jgi:hypothetical protein
MSEQVAIAIGCILYESCPNTYRITAFPLKKIILEYDI